MKIYCDTDTLFHNVKRQEKEPKTKNELLALQNARPKLIVETDQFRPRPRNSCSCSPTWQLSSSP